MTTTKIATKNALAAELERLFSGLPSAVPRRWVMGDRTGYTPLREACPDCPPRSREGSAWNLHARAKGEEVLARGGSKKASRTAEKAEKERHNVAWHAGHWRMHVTAGEAHYLGVYTVVPQESGATTGLVAIDLDDHGGQGDLNPHGRLEGLADSAEALGVGRAFFGNTSRGGKGRHARLCVDPSTPAWLAREIGLRWLDHAGITPRPALGSPEEAAWLERFGENPDGMIEVYPKQDGEKGGYGNLLGLPCSLELMAEGRTAAFARGSWEPIREAAPALEVLRAVRPLAPDEVRELATRLEIDPDAPPKRKAQKSLKPKKPKGGRTDPHGAPARVRRDQIAFLDHDPEEDAQRAREALKLIPADAYDEWLAVGMALEGSGLASGRSLWDEWASTSEKFDADTQEDKWHSFSGSGRSLGTLFLLAKDHGWDYRDFYREQLREAESRAAASPGVALESGTIRALRKLGKAEREAMIVRLKAANGKVGVGEIRKEITAQRKREEADKVLAARGDAPLIEVSTQVKDLVNAAEAAMAKRSLGVFHRGGALVRILEQDDGSCAIGAVSLPSLHEELSDAASWVKETDEGLFPLEPPRPVVEALHARGWWPRLRVLERIATAPCLRADGTVLQGEARYDELSRVAYEPDADYPLVPEAPTHAQAQKALMALKEPLGDFCFASTVDRSAALASILALAGRGAVDGCSPLVLINGNAPGLGKGLLTDVMGLIATGVEPRKIAPMRTPEEEDKRILSLGFEGVEVAVIDNVAADLGSDALDRALTTERFSGRVLGATKTVTVRPPMFWATGNGVAVRGDLVRRLILCELKTDLERPELRTGFELPDLKSWVKANRPRLLVAALTVLRWHLANGCPPAAAPLGSFERWSSVVRDCLIHLGESDPVVSQEGLREVADPALLALKRLVTTWAGELGGGELSAADLVKRAQDVGGAKFAEALREYCPPRRGESFPTAGQLGSRLRKVADRVVDGLRVVNRGRVKNVTQWAVERVDGAAVEGPGSLVDHYSRMADSAEE